VVVIFRYLRNLCWSRNQYEDINFTDEKVVLMENNDDQRIFGEAREVDLTLYFVLAASSRPHCRNDLPASSANFSANGRWRTGVAIFFT